jgi:hypothetical protein
MKLLGLPTNLYSTDGMNGSKSHLKVCKTNFSYSSECHHQSVNGYGMNVVLARHWSIIFPPFQKKRSQFFTSILIKYTNCTFAIECAIGFQLQKMRVHAPCMVGLSKAYDMLNDANSTFWSSSLMLASRVSNDSQQPKSRNKNITA